MRSSLTLLIVSLLLALALPGIAVGAEPELPSEVTEQMSSLSLDEVLPSGTGAGSAGQIIGQVEHIAFGSQGATITLEGGKQVRLDFSGMTGTGGGPNYIGWAMVLFGMSVATRLLSSIARVLRPLSMVPRRRRRYHDEP